MYFAVPRMLLVLYLLPHFPLPHFPFPHFPFPLYYHPLSPPHRSPGSALQSAFSAVYPVPVYHPAFFPLPLPAPTLPHEQLEHIAHETREWEEKERNSFLKGKLVFITLLAGIVLLIGTVLALFCK